ncbi:uncharacterized protein LOC118433263 isoform X2 [Folsomia candida]|uniref:uncharacterized protein LOC118433263 isoform X2 n=1 Tax=Folsomia candida TaxID=158441 RepID=UPI0016055E90|nr:uncharacterized protein LOC118433263 isoform X2 [Folsomia candida]
MCNLVQSAIFGFLPPSALKACRQVCKDWEREATFHLGKCSRLSLNKFCGSGPLHKLMPICDDRFCGRIYLDYDHAEEKDLAKWDSIGHKFAVFLMEKGVLVGDLKVEMDPYFLPKLRYLIVDCGFFPNLEVLSLYERHPEGPFTPLMPEALETPEIMRHIRRLEFCRAEGSIENPENAGNASTFHPFLEEIIEKSPNLEELKIEDNFYPVLTTCSKLKIVDFSGYPYGFELIDNDEDDDTHRDIRPDFSLVKVFRMLEEVSGWLEKLVLGSSSSKMLFKETPTVVNVVDQVSNFRLPFFPKLGEFYFNAVNIYGIGLERLTKKHFPSLKKLWLREDPEFDGNGRLYQTFMDVDTHLSHVETLGMANFLIGAKSRLVLDNFPPIEPAFPNLKSFFITIDTWLGDDGPTESGGLAELLKLLVAMFDKVENLVVRLDWVKSMQEVMHATGLPELDGLKTLKLVDYNETVTQDDGSDDPPEDVTFPVIGLLILENFTFKLRGDSGPRITNYVAKHKGNVIFTNSASSLMSKRRDLY